MAGNFIWLTLLISYIKLSVESQWIVDYFEGEDSSSSTTSFTKRKGEFFVIKLKFSFEQGQDQPPPATGLLIIDNTDFKQANQCIVDTTEDRTYLLLIGVSCASTLTYYEEHLIHLSLSSADTNKIKWEPISITFEKKKIPLTVQLERAVLEQNSYSLYSLAFIRNVDELSIDFKHSDQIQVDPLFLSEYSPEKRREQFKVYGKYTSIYSDYLLEYKVDLKLDGTNINCFDLTPSLSWTMSKINLPDLLDKKNLVLRDTDVDKSPQSSIQFHLRVDFKPVLISCGISSTYDMSKLTQEIVTDPLALEGMFSNDFDIYQTYHQTEGTAKMIFKRANRFSLGFTAVCYIQTLIFKNKTFSQETLRIVLSNSNERDKTLTLKAEHPFPTQCLIWKFDKQIDKSVFDSKIIPYCREYFSKEKPLREKGCLVCESRTAGLNSDNKVGMCIHSDIACPINYEGSIKDDANGFLNTVNTQEKMMEKFSLDVPPIESIIHSSDDDGIDIGKLIIKITKINKEDIELNIDSSKMNQTIRCLIKPINNKPFDDVTEGDFTINQQILDIVPLKTNYNISFTKPGYDNATYNIIGICFNFANYVYHSRHTSPFILATFLRTNVSPIEIPSKEKQKCEKDTIHPQCVVYQIKELPKLKNGDYKPDIAHELENFSRLTQGYKYLMLIDEYEEYLRVKIKRDIIDKTVYLLELLSNENCIKHTDYDYCRSLKKKYMTVLVNYFVKQFDSNDLLKDIEGISAQHRQNIPLIAITLFDMSNNPDSFTEPLFRELLTFIQQIVDKHDEIIEIISKQKPASSLPYDIENNLELKLNAKKDYTHILLLSQINLLDITAYLEADKDKSFLKNNSADTLNDTSIKQIYSNIEKLLPYVASYGYNTVSYENFQLKIYSKFYQENSDEYEINFDNFDINVTFQKSDLFKAANVDYLFIYAIKKHPYLSHFSLNYYLNTVSFRQYKVVEGKIKLSDQVTLNPNPTIVYDMNKINSNFKESFRFDSEKGEFVNEYSKLRLSNNKWNSCFHVIISKVGDYSFGNATNFGTAWIIGTLSAIGVILVAGVSFFLFSYISKKKSDNPIELIHPISER